MASRRLQWMDFIRGICVLLVIFGHAAYVTGDVASHTFFEGFAIFNLFMDPFRIPLLMFLSGMLLHKSLGKPTPDYLSGKFYLIFWPFLVWSIAIYAAENRLTLENILKTPISAPSVLWYLWFLCAFYMIALVLIRKSVPLIPVVLVCVVLSGVLPGVLRIDRFASLFAFFLGGHIVLSRNLVGRVTAPIAIVGLCAAILGGMISVFGHPIKYDPLYIWVPAGLIAFVLWASMFFKTTAASAPFEWVGRNSIVFYAAHFPALVISARWIPWNPEWSGTLFYILLFLWVLALGTALQLLRERFPAVEALFDFRPILRVAKAWRASSRNTGV
ncbi:acyltransferase [Sandarakinorhabdus sp.]|uniref:acyltransferase n=1 Tax=Sandarakinorhabdus sp. TaxID=1916663 RepID=UPI003342082E